MCVGERPDPRSGARRGPSPADGVVVAGAGGAGGAAVRGAAAAPPGGRQGSQATGADPDLRRTARGVAGAALRAAGGGHAQRLPPHPAARAAGPTAQRQLPGRGAAGRRQEVPAPRQPAQRLAVGLQVTAGHRRGCGGGRGRRGCSSRVRGAKRWQGPGGLKRAGRPVWGPPSVPRLPGGLAAFPRAVPWGLLREAAALRGEGCSEQQPGGKGVEVGV